jgi:hypothetical protein
MKKMFIEAKALKVHSSEGLHIEAVEMHEEQQ